jgi:hypothetical protein
MEESERLYIEGFNQGYLLAQYEPELSEKLSSAPTESPYLEGLQGGREQYIDERLKARLPSWLKEDPFLKSDIEPDRDKDSLEPEI